MADSTGIPALAEIKVTAKDTFEVSRKGRAPRAADPAYVKLASKVDSTYLPFPLPKGAEAELRRAAAEVGRKAHFQRGTVGGKDVVRFWTEAVPEVSE